MVARQVGVQDGYGSLRIGSSRLVEISGETPAQGFLPNGGEGIPVIVYVVGEPLSRSASHRGQWVSHQALEHRPVVMAWKVPGLPMVPR